MSTTLQMPSVLQVHTLLAARILADPDVAIYLKPFMRGPTTVKAAAEEFKQSLQAMHYRVEQMLRAGLLEVVGLESRRGRAIKHYQSTAEAFQVSVDLIPSSLYQALSEYASWKSLLERGLRKANPDPDRDLMVVYLDKDDALVWGTGLDSKLVKPEELADAFPAIFNTWAGALRLDKADAKALQRELWELYERYAHRGGSSKYVMHLGLAPHPDWS